MSDIQMVANDPNLKVFQLYITVLFLVLGSISSLFGQDQEKDTLGEQLIVKNSDNFIVEHIDDIDRQYFRGNVRLVQDSTFMFCDSAVIIDNHLTASGDIVIIQKDSTNVFSDSLIYDGDKRIARLFYDVVLENADKQLFTDSLLYDLDLKVASFQDTAILKKETMTLSSLRGFYNMDTKLARFYDEVVIIDKNFKLNTDSLLYNIEEDRAYFIGPTFIIQNGRKIYCEDGYYDIESESAHFSGNAIIRSEDGIAEGGLIYYSGKDSLLTLTTDAVLRDSSSIAQGDQIIIDDRSGGITINGNGYYADENQILTGPEIIFNKETRDINLKGRSKITNEDGYLEGDTILYYSKDDLGTAFGNVIYTDTIENRVLKSGKILFRDSTSFYKAVSTDLRPVISQQIDDDTLYLSADILKSGSIGDTIRYMQGMGSVMIYKSDFQAKCDSIYYSDIDSIFVLYHNPVCWSDTTQFKGDTIRLKISDKSITSINALNNAFICSKVSDKYYDQIKAKNIYSKLDSNKLKRMDAIGNAESIYMIKDDEDAFVGPDKTVCSKMIFYFSGDSLDRVGFLGQPESKLIPMKKAGNNDLFLSGFIWDNSSRPEDPISIRQITAERSVLENEITKDKDPFDEPVSEILDKALNDKIPDGQKSKKVLDKAKSGSIEKKKKDK
ncbi:MAG: hypothetical protein KJO29_06370 [Bacteroidia bacterium]|nr:hypothetical protein [Bacteroidia bacterium]